MSSTDTPARTNWAGVLIAAVGALELVVTVLSSLPVTGLLPAVVHVLAIGTYLSPLALIVAFVPLTFGSRRLLGIAGDGLRSRGLLFGAAIVAAIAQYAGIVLLLDELGASEQTSEAESSASLTLQVFAVLLGLIAAIAVARARVVSGVARWSLILAVVLIGFTVVLNFVDPAIGSLYWADVPRAVGLILLGISYWRAGLRSVPLSKALEAPSVTAGAKSLAE